MTSFPFPVHHLPSCFFVFFKTSGYAPMSGIWKYHSCKMCISCTSTCHSRLRMTRGSYKNKLWKHQPRFHPKWTQLLAQETTFFEELEPDFHQHFLAFPLSKVVDVTKRTAPCRPDVEVPGTQIQHLKVEARKTMQSIDSLLLHYRSFSKTLIVPKLSVFPPQSKNLRRRNYPADTDGCLYTWPYDSADQSSICC